MEQQAPVVSNDSGQRQGHPASYVVVACLAAVAILVIAFIATHCSLEAPAWLFVVGWISAAAVGIVCDMQILDLCDGGSIEAGRRMVLRLGTYVLFVVHCGSLLPLMFLCVGGP